MTLTIQAFWQCMPLPCYVVRGLRRHGTHRQPLRQ